VPKEIIENRYFKTNETTMVFHQIFLDEGGPCVCKGRSSAVRRSPFFEEQEDWCMTAAVMLRMIESTYGPSTIVFNMGKFFLWQTLYRLLFKLT
jgi:hypothetical protein